MLSRNQRRRFAYGLLFCTLLGTVWLASPAAAAAVTAAMQESSDEEDPQAPPLTEEVEERVAELDAPLTGRVAVSRGTHVRLDADRICRPGHGSPLDRPPRA